jgi:hypothetical protein
MRRFLCTAGTAVASQWCVPMRLLLLCAAAAACLAAADAACPNASAAQHAQRGGCDQKQLATATYAACSAACCDDPLCAAWNWDSNLTAAQRHGGCVGHPGGCCWLKTCVEPSSTHSMCGAGGEPGCTSWTGTSGRPSIAPVPPPPPPPPPPVCPMGEGKPCFHNHGTPTCACVTHWSPPLTTVASAPLCSNHLRPTD